MLEIRNLSKFVDGARILGPVSLEIKHGEFFAVLGPSGSGKSTLLGLIAGIIPCDDGDIFLSHRSLTHVSAHLRRFALVYQNAALLPHLNVFDNVAFPVVALKYALEKRWWRKSAYLFGPMRRLLSDKEFDRAQAALHLVKLDQFHKRRVDTLSGGEAQRVALARALVIQPELLLMDEPLASLDRQLKLEMRSELKRIQKETHISVVYVTHDQEEAVTLADRMALLHQGQLQQVGSPVDILRNPANDWVKKFFNPEHIASKEIVELLKRL